MICNENDLFWKVELNIIIWCSFDLFYYSCIIIDVNGCWILNVGYIRCDNGEILFGYGYVCIILIFVVEI